MKSKKKSVRVVITMSQEQYQEYSKLLKIINKHCGDDWDMDYLLWSNLASAADIADGLVGLDLIDSVKDEDRIALHKEFKAAGLSLW